MQKISATELARHTRAVLHRVATGGEALAVERNHTLIARLVPAERTMTAAQALAGLESHLTPEQASEWLKDSRNVFDETVRDPWA